MRSVKENKNHYKRTSAPTFYDDKENNKILSRTKIKVNESQNGTTNVKNKVFKRIENELTPKLKNEYKKNALEETEKILRHLDTDYCEKNKKDIEDKSSTILSDCEKSEISTCHKLEKEVDRKTKQIHERRLEDFFIKKPTGKFIDSNASTIDEWYIYEELLHPLISSPTGNKEVEKKILIKKHLKKPSIQNYKTDSCKTYQYLFNGSGKRNFLELNSLYDEEKAPTKLIDQVKFANKRKISSCKKVYESILVFHDSKNYSHSFNVYNDSETGFNNKYNQILKIMEIDNDIDTDEEQLYLAKNFALDNLNDTIKNFNTRQLNNKMRFKRSRTTRPVLRSRL